MREGCRFIPRSTDKYILPMAEMFNISDNLNERKHAKKSANFEAVFCQ
jgi:hypothetical protein